MSIAIEQELKPKTLALSNLSGTQPRDEFMRNSAYRSTAPIAYFGAGLWAMALVVSPVVVEAKSASPFADFSGGWSGGGEIQMSDGSREGIRCKANYSPQQGGTALKINVSCASDSYNVQVTSDVVAGSDGGITGSWQELTHEVSGDVTGRTPSPGELQANLEGTTYGIQLSISTRGSRQVIATRMDGAGVQSVKIDLHRA